MALIDDFKTRFPDFDTDTVDKYLPLLEGVWPCFWRGRYKNCGKEIVLNLMAHLITQESADSTAEGTAPLKIESSKSVGSVSISYATSSDATDRDLWLASTSFGLRFLWLIKHHHGGAFV